MRLDDRIDPRAVEEIEGGKLSSRENTLIRDGGLRLHRQRRHRRKRKLPDYGRRHDPRWEKVEVLP